MWPRLLCDFDPRIIWIAPTRNTKRLPAFCYGVGVCVGVCVGINVGVGVGVGIDFFGCDVGI